MLNEFMPSVITNIIFEYYIHHRKEWTKQLMKSVLYEIKTINPYYSQYKSSYNKIKRSILSATRPERLYGDDTLMEKQHGDVHTRMLDEMSNQYLSIEMQRHKQEFPNEIYYHEFGHVGYHHFNRFQDMSAFKSKQKRISNRSMTKLGFSLKQREDIKYCRDCQLVLPISKFKIIDTHELLTLGNRCISCQKIYRAKNRKQNKKVRGFKSLPEDIQNEIIDMLKNNISMKKISIHFANQTDQYKLLKYSSLLRLKRLGEINY